MTDQLQIWRLWCGTSVFSM